MLAFLNAFEFSADGKKKNPWVRGQEKDPLACPKISS
jgi:hypothetical protein